MKRRSKKRTHVSKNQVEGLPKALVLRSGVVGKSIARFVYDLRRVMEPNTAMKLKERKTNKLKDFVHIAGQFHITHLMLLSKTDHAVNLRIGRLPRGPTLTFRIIEYSLTKDVLSMQKTPKSPGSDFKTSPLVVLNNFCSSEKHIKLMATVLQNLFPAIDVQRMKLADARRVVIFNLNSETGVIDFRHYGITVKSVGLSKSVKNIIQTNIPDLSNYQDISDYVLRGAVVSESDVEDAVDSTVNLPQKYVGRGNTASEHRAVRLVELGPRMQLKLIKIQTGLCGGEVLYHENVQSKLKIDVERMDTD